MTFASIGTSRHRLGSDGVGVTTLVGGHGCPLDCKYCLNPQCKRKDVSFYFTADELYERLRLDSLYFAATGGGVTFGGGEPLLQAGFIRDFIDHCRKKGEVWRFSLETCLAVDKKSLALLDGYIDEYIVDVKDMNADIYKAYTGSSADHMKENLRELQGLADRVTLKLPLIPDFNTVEDVLRSETELRSLGFIRFNRFRYITDIKK